MALAALTGSCARAQHQQGAVAAELAQTPPTAEEMAAALEQEKQTAQQARLQMEKTVSFSRKPASAPSGQPLYLREAVDLALRENFGLQITRYTPSIRADEVEAARADFDWNLSAAFSHTESVSPQATSILDGSRRPSGQGDSYGVTLSQKFITGGTVQVGSGFGRSENNSTNSILNPNYSSTTGLRVTQPLLAGGGVDVNLAPVAIALSSYRQSKYELRKSILDLMADTEVSYWNLAATYQLRKLHETSVQLARSMLEENRERARIGLATHAEVLESEAYLAARLENIIIAQQNIENAEDTLRALLGTLSFESDRSISPAPLPQDDPGLPVFQEVVRRSLSQDYAYFVQQEEIEKQRQRLLVARNANQPAFNVSAGMYGLGTDGAPWTSYRNSYEADGNNWNVGVALSMPVGFRAERADVRRAGKNLDVANLRLAEIQQQLMADVRKAWRSVAAGRQRRITTLTSLELNLESYQRQQAQYRAGIISLRDLLQAQTDLDNARINNLQAAYDLIVADVRLKRLTGEILGRNGFSWVDVESQVNLDNASVEKLSVKSEPKSSQP